MRGADAARGFWKCHGESTLEDYTWPDGSQGKLLSNPGFKYDFGWSLTEKGRAQLLKTADHMEEELDFDDGWIYTSNFQRSYQSALVLRESMSMGFAFLRTEFSGLLDPRKVGDLDGKPSATMAPVYANDANDVFSTPPPVPSSLQPSASVESVQDVYRRALEAITRLERSYFGSDVVLVSHADTLSIYAAAMFGTDLGRHHYDWPFEHGQCVVYDQAYVAKGLAPRCFNPNGPIKFSATGIVRDVKLEDYLPPPAETVSAARTLWT